MNIILTGFKYSGKSTIGKLFAELYDYAFIDTDDLVLKRCNQEHISHLVHSLGEDEFRNIEHDVVQNITTTTPTVIATGGGVVLNKNNTDYLRQFGQIVLLDVDYDILFERMMAAKRLPTFIDPNNTQQSFERYLTHRGALYYSSADIVLDISAQTPEEVAQVLKETVNGQ